MPGKFQVQNTEKLKSAEVPQLPRDLAKVADFVYALAKVKEEFPDYGKAQQRAADYVCQSAAILGLVTSTKIKDTHLTPTGRVFSAMSLTEQRRRLSYAFEASRVGSMWLMWAGVRDLRQLKGSQAAEFLNECATNLSEGEEGTLQMRAGALDAWLTQLKEARNQRELADIRPLHRPCPLDQLRTSVFEPRGSYNLVHALVQGCSKIDIATGFFTLDGFELIADGLDNPDIRIIVGGFEDDRRSANHAAFLVRFVESLDRGLDPPREVKRAVINQIYWRIVHGNISLRSLDARMIERLHAKIFIFGQRAAYVTSANLTKSGLQRNVEGGHLLTETDRAVDIAYLGAKFDEHWRDGVPLAEEVLRKIEESWFFQDPVLPYLAFLRALFLLYGRPKEPDRVPARQLAEFQKLLVQHLLGKLTERRGVLFVAPTGTGKTVMSAYIAAALWGTTIRRVLVVCNNDSLKRYWTREIQMMGIDAHIITSGRLRGKSKHPEQSLEDIDHVKKYLHEDTLVIVDECHQYRTPKSKGYGAIRSLLLPEDERMRPHVLLLTATPISRGLDNLHALLSLTAYDELDEIKTCAAAAMEPGLVNVTLPDILRRFGIDDVANDKRALEFADGLRHYPHIELELVLYATPMAAIFKQIADFATLLQNYEGLEEAIALKLRETGDLDEDDELTGNLRKQANLLKTILGRRAESSPAALVRTIERIIDAVQERDLGESERRKLTDALEPILLEGRKIIATEGADSKLQNIFAVLRKHRTQKILIFTEYIDTATYLNERLNAVFGRSREIELLTGNTSKGEKRRLILNFAPEAQGGVCTTPIDILIGTDAISEGENLQDARVLVNYDLPWTPLRLVQRLGRVDRPTVYTRKVHAYNYFPAGMQYRELVTHWTRLEGRSAHVRDISDSEVLMSTSRNPSHYRDKPKQLYFEVAQTYRDLLNAVREQQIPTSTFLQVQLRADEELLRKAEALPAGVFTSRESAIAAPGLYLLIEIEGIFHCLIHCADELFHRPIDRHRFLLALKSEPDTPLVDFPRDMEKRVDEVLRRWVEYLPPEDAERVRLQVALWVVPPSQVGPGGTGVAVTGAS